MKAVVCRKFGPPENLRIEDCHTPQMDSNQVRIAVRACGVNFPDLLIVAGKYQFKPTLPFTPGAELAGKIIEVGDDISHLKPGQRVLAVTQTGAMATEICVSGQAVVPIPAAMQYETAAGFMLTYATSYHALRQRAQLNQGETLLVLGAAGGVGLAAVELGAVMGATVIAAASSKARLALAKLHGAAHVIDYADAELRTSVLELTDGRGADVIFDPVGGSLFADCLRCIAWRGRILVVGFASGHIQSIPANLPLLKGCSIVGVFWGRFAEQEATQQAANVQRLIELYNAGRIRPHIDKTFPIEDAAAAIRYLADRRALGKVVITI